ncbi:MAG TPA: PqqD family protein [Jatrophihabitans sp.]|nr:PqqD family protein [Jatrophihabitans sp.]
MSSHYLPADQVTVEELDDGLCLFRAADDEVLVLNATAADIWRLADGTSDTARLCELLAAAYGTRPATIEADVRRTLDELTGKGYLRAVDGPAG